MPLIPALGRQRQVDLCEFDASLVYRGSFSISRAVTQRKPYLEKKIIYGLVHEASAAKPR